MTGGRIGKDGIHGATFSSEALSESSPTSAVQIGDPITQKKMLDCCWKRATAACTGASPTTAPAAFPPPWERWRASAAAFPSTSTPAR